MKIFQTKSLVYACMMIHMHMNSCVHMNQYHINIYPSVQPVVSVIGRCVMTTLWDLEAVSKYGTCPGKVQLVSFSPLKARKISEVMCMLLS